MANYPLEAAIFWAKAAAHGEVATLLSKVMAGISLGEAKRQLGVTHGTRTDMSGHDLLADGWDAFIKSHLGVSRQTASIWIKLGELAKVRLRKMGSFDAGDVLDLATMPKSQFAALREALAKLCDGTTQDQLALELGLVKSNKRGTGGRRIAGSGGEDAPLDPMLTPVGWDGTDAEWQEYAELALNNPTARAAVDAWKPTLSFLREHGLDGKSWAHLPTAMQTELRAALAEIVRLMPGRAK